MRPSAVPEPADFPAPEARLRLTSEGLAWLAFTLLLAAVGWWKSLNPLLLLAYTMGSLIVLNGVLARRQVRRVRVAGLASRPVFVGEETRVAVAIRNTGSGPASVGILDPAVGPPGGWHVAALPPGARAECAESRSFPNRGRFVSEPRVWSGFPFGLLRCERAADTGIERVVLPACGTVDPAGLRRWLLQQGDGMGSSRRILRRATSDQADVRGVRPYRPGDSMRWVHWRSTARHGELMVREYDAVPSPNLLLVVEPWLPAEPSADDRLHLEAALSLAVTMVRTWARQGEAWITVVVAAAEPVVCSVPGGACVRITLGPLAGVEGTSAPAIPAPATFGRFLTRATRVIVSSRRQTPLGEGLSRLTGRSFVTLDPTSRLPWYRPPAAGEPKVE